MCPFYINEVVTMERTLLDSSIIFHILGATFGINQVLKSVKNPYYWHVTHWYLRIIIGVFGFSINYLISLYYTHKVFDVVTNYAIEAFMSALSGFICYGFVPILFDKFNLLNEDVSEEIIRKKYLQFKAKGK